MYIDNTKMRITGGSQDYTYADLWVVKILM